jgi:hypothetical protein
LSIENTRVQLERGLGVPVEVRAAYNNTSEFKFHLGHIRILISGLLDRWEVEIHPDGRDANNNRFLTAIMLRFNSSMPSGPHTTPEEAAVKTLNCIIRARQTLQPKWEETQKQILHAHTVADAAVVALVSMGKWATRRLDFQTILG